MPNRDHTGPCGGGPKTGRGLGLCSGNASQAEPRETSGGMGRGRCNGRSSGRGKGRGHGPGNCRGRGLGRGNGWGSANWFSGDRTDLQVKAPFQSGDVQLRAIESETDRRDLTHQAEWLRDQLQQIEERLSASKQK